MHSDSSVGANLEKTTMITTFLKNLYKIFNKLYIILLSLKDVEW